MVPKLACGAKDADGQIIETDAFRILGCHWQRKHVFNSFAMCEEVGQERLYGNKMGYFGGVNCNIPDGPRLPTLSSCYLLRDLLILFFRTYAGWAWPKPVQLNRIQPNPPTASYGERKEVWNAGERWFDLMPIITPAYPAFNSSLSVTAHRV